MSPDSAEYLHPESTGIANPRRTGTGLAHFFGGEQDQQTLTLRWALSTYASRMPDGFVPVATDGAGNLICWGRGLEHGPGFYWWDHENEWDEEDYADDTGEPMPEAAKLQNVHHLADDFEQLLRRFEVASA